MYPRSDFNQHKSKVKRDRESKKKKKERDDKVPLMKDNKELDETSRTGVWWLIATRMSTSLRRMSFSQKCFHKSILTEKGGERLNPYATVPFQKGTLVLGTLPLIWKVGVRGFVFPHQKCSITLNMQRCGKKAFNECWKDARWETHFPNLRYTSWLRS